MTRTDHVPAALAAANPVDEALLATAVRGPVAADLRAAVDERRTPSGAAGGRPTRRRLLVAVAVTVVAVLTGGAGYGAWLLTHPGQSAVPTCRTAPQGWTQGLTTSGDPVADCAPVFLRDTGSVPPLTAYATDDGVVVQPSDWQVPAGWRALEPAFRLDPAYLQARRLLSDQVAGLADACLDDAAADRRVDALLADAGLSGWSTDHRGEADGRTTCARFVDLVPERQEVLVEALAASGPEGLPFERLVAGLRVRPPCQDRAAALSAVRAAGAAAGMPESVEGFTVQELDRPDGSCALVTVAVGGAVVVQVSGG